jgi:hypothetical protein
MEPEPALNESILGCARELLQLLADGRPTQGILQLLANQPKLPLWVQEEETGWSVLHFAALREDSSLIQAFIDAGAVWNLGNSFNRGWESSFLNYISISTSRSSRIYRRRCRALCQQFGMLPSDSRRRATVWYVMAP